jgi:5-carboxymethyl-2-hydroxymuconate isomerase
MPHFIAECTDNIREQADLPGLFAKERGAGRHRHLPIGGIRSRATGWIPGRWPTASTDYAFVHMTLKIGRRAQPGEP